MGEEQIEYQLREIKQAIDELNRILKDVVKAIIQLKNE